jgi:RimJ/RimL family protein N-acetyltransferase
MTPEDELKWFEGLNERKPSDIVFAIVLKESDELIGTMGLHGVDFRNGTAKTGSFIGNKKYWGKGFGTEAKMILLEYAFNTLNLRKICSVVYDYNGRSKRCLEKCGYHEEGILKQHQFRNGSYHDAFQMAVFRDEFFPFWETYRKKFLE